MPTTPLTVHSGRRSSLQQIGFSLSPPQSLPACGCKKHVMDLNGDHTSTCTAHAGATKAHDWMVGVLGPLFRTAGHTVRTQHGVAASAGQKKRFATTYETKMQDVSRSWSSTSASRMSALAQVATCNKMGCSRSRRTSMRLCVLLRSARSLIIDNSTVRRQSEHFFSPHHCQHLHPQTLPLAAASAAGRRQLGASPGGERQKTGWAGPPEPPGPNVAARARAR